jgi:hypothetical protein
VKLDSSFHNDWCEFLNGPPVNSRSPTPSSSSSASPPLSISPKLSASTSASHASASTTAASSPSALSFSRSSSCSDLFLTPSSSRSPSPASVSFSDSDTEEPCDFELYDDDQWYMHSCTARPDLRRTSFEELHLDQHRPSQTEHKRDTHTHDAVCDGFPVAAHCLSFAAMPSVFPRPTLPVSVNPFAVLHDLPE